MGEAHLVHFGQPFEKLARYFSCIILITTTIVIKILFEIAKRKVLHRDVYGICLIVPTFEEHKQIVVLF